jgi:glutamate-ammonia-ligase adenylyltransferase
LFALDALGVAGLLPEDAVLQLKEDYIFLRRTEHFLQILHDRQIHVLPADPTEMRALAKRMLGSRGDAPRFMEDLNACLKRVHRSYRTFLLGEGPPAFPPSRP